MTEQFLPHNSRPLPSIPENTEKQVFKLYTDGSYQAGKAGIGIGGYILNEKEEEVLSFRDSVEHRQDKDGVAAFEALALLKGLELALNQNIKHLKCFSDDRGLCELSHNYKTVGQKKQKHITKNPTLSAVYNLIDKFETIEFQYIPRQQNTKADKLSKFQALVIEQKNKENLFQQSAEEVEAYKNMKVADRQRLLLSDYFLKEKERAVCQSLVSTTLVFHAVQDTQKKWWLEVYIATKKDSKNAVPDNNLEQEKEIVLGYDYELYRKKSITATWRNQALYYLQNYLKHQSPAQFSIMTIGARLTDFENVFKRRISHIPKLLESLNEIEVLLKNKEYVSYQHNKKIEKEIKLFAGHHILKGSAYCPNVVKEENQLDQEKSKIIQHIELFHNNYQPGACPEIEQLYYRKREDRTVPLEREEYKNRSIASLVSWYIQNQKSCEDFQGVKKEEIVKFAMAEVEELKKPRSQNNVRP